MAEMLTKADLIRRISGKAKVSKSQAERVLDSLVEETFLSLRRGQSVRLGGLGEIRVLTSKKKMQLRRNPRTGEPIKIPVKRELNFRVAKAAMGPILGRK